MIRNKIYLSEEKCYKPAPIVFVVEEFSAIRNIYEPLAKKGTLGYKLRIVSEDGDLIKEYEA